MDEKRLSRRDFLRIAGGVTGMTLLAACAPPAGAPAAAPSAGEGGGEAAGGAAPAAESAVSEEHPLWVLHTKDYHPDYNDFIRAHIENFAAEKGYPLEVAYTAGFLAGGADIQKITAAVASGDAPDVWLHSVSVPQMKALGNVQKVDDLVEEFVAQYGEIAPLMRKNTFVDDGFYGVPFHGRASGGYARQDVFEAAGIDIQTVRQYDQLREVCMEVSDPDAEMWGWGMTINRSGDGNGLLTRVLHGWGAKWVDETGTKIMLEETLDEAVAAINWLVETYTDPAWERMLPPGVLSWTDSNNNEAYLGSKIAYTQNAGTVLAKAYFDNNPVAEVTAYHPQCGGPVVQEFNGISGQNFLLMTNARNVEAGKELIRSFFTEESMQAVYENARAYAVPAYASMWDWPIIKDTPQSIAVKPAALDPSGYNGLAWPGPATAQIDAVNNANIHADMIASVINGEATPEEAVRTAAERSRQIFRDFGIENP
ncbi:MAG: extracellular solute-binding protein [Caldilineae bacterium]|nr:MAG: extracellular solute-binding protein [Caldilineae bacterium]